MTVHSDQVIQLGLMPGGKELMASAVGVALLDRSGVVVSLNPTWLDLARHKSGGADLSGVGESYLESWTASGDTLVSVRVTDAILAALRGDLPVPMRIRTRSHFSDQTHWLDQSIASRFADSGTILGATVTLSQSDSRTENAQFAADDLRDEVVRLLFGAGLAMDALIDRLIDLDSRLILDTAVTHLNDVVCHVRLMFHEADRRQEVLNNATE